MAGRLGMRARRAQIVARADSVGAVKAGEEFGVNPATIRSWRRRIREEGAAAAAIVPPPVADSVSEEDLEGDGAPVSPDALERLRLTAERARRVEAKAAAETERLLGLGKPAEARNAASAGSQWGHQALRLEVAIAETHALNARVSGGQAEVVAMVLRRLLRALGVPEGAAVRAAARELLESAQSAEGPSVSVGAAQAAFAEVHEHFARVVRRELEDERGMLAAGSLSDDEQDEAEARRLCEAPLAGDEVVVVEAEVVADGRSIEERAKELADRVIANMAAEEAEQEGFGVGRHPSRAGGFDIDDPAASIMRGGPQRWS